LDEGVLNLAVLACVLRATTRKKSSTFLGKNVHPRENPGYAYGCRCAPGAKTQ